MLAALSRGVILSTGTMGFRGRSRRAFTLIVATGEAADG